MPQTHPPYPWEYRRRIVELARAGRSVNELAHEFQPSASAIRYWLKQAGLDEGLRSDSLTTQERAELNRIHSPRAAAPSAATPSAAVRAKSTPAQARYTSH